MKRIDELEKKEEASAKREKKNNIVIKGLQAEPNLLNETVTSLLKDKLGVEVRITKTFSIKTAKNGDLIIAKLSCFEDKRLVMANKNKLVGSEFYISSDRTKKERDIQREISKIADYESKNGNSVKIGFKKLTVNGITNVWKEGVGFIEQGSPEQSLFRSQTNAY